MNDKKLKEKEQKRAPGPKFQSALPEDYQIRRPSPTPLADILRASERPAEIAGPVNIATPAESASPANEVIRGRQFASPERWPEQGGQGGQRDHGRRGEITWRVHLANRKAGWYQFLNAMDLGPKYAKTAALRFCRDPKFTTEASRRPSFWRHIFRDALRAYAQLIDRAFAQYLLMHHDRYLVEQRGPDATFWRRRHAPNFHGEKNSPVSSLSKAFR
jgi:hypothetical protein